MLGRNCGQVNDPDKLDTMAQELRDYATRRTARINEAYDRLRSARV